MIEYSYDPLYRLTAADYSTGDFYHYAYDAVGNRMTQESLVSGLSLTNTYTYDIANRLVNVDGVAYTWDANGNLLNDGVNTYTYDYANRLIGASNPPSGTSQSSVSSYKYSGLGDRLQQTVNGEVTNYTLDLNAGLTQVLEDGSYSYTYGVGRISQQQGITSEYFLGDALGSVRQLTDQSSAVTLAKSYDPYGNVVGSSGNGSSVFAYTGEQVDANGLVYLRARYYNPSTGRLTTRDTWEGNDNSPMSMNRWIYVKGNPINFVDPSGNIPTKQEVATGRQVYSCNCGWIDFGHAGSRLALSIIDLLNKEKEHFPLTHHSPVIRGDVFAITPSSLSE